MVSFGYHRRSGGRRRLRFVKRDRTDGRTDGTGRGSRDGRTTRNNDNDNNREPGTAETSKYNTVGRGKNRVRACYLIDARQGI